MAALSELGGTLTDLQRDTRPRRPAFHEYLPNVVAAADQPGPADLPEP